MSVYTVHEPPLRAGHSEPEADRVAFVRDGFHFWAFVLAPLWMLWHRMWLVLAGYVILVGVLEAALVVLRASPTVISLVGFLVSILIGLEASTLRRLSLRLRGWNNVAVVSGDDLEEAERRYFDIRFVTPPHSGDANGAPAATRSGGPPPMPRPAQPGVIGLFPEPGVRR